MKVFALKLAGRLGLKPGHLGFNSSALITKLEGLEPTPETSRGSNIGELPKVSDVRHDTSVIRLINHYHRLLTNY